MKTDYELKSLLKIINKLRAYDDEMSVLIRMKMIEELNNQNKMILISAKTYLERKENE